MRVLVNALSVSPGGSLTVASGLLPALARIPGHELRILTKDDVLERQCAWPDNVSFEQHARAAQSNGRRFLFEQRKLGPRMARGEHDVYFDVAGFGLFRRGLAQVILVRNAYFYVSEPWMTRRARLRLRLQRWYQIKSWRHGAAAVCVSKYMADALEPYRREGVGPVPIIPHGLSDAFITRAQSDAASTSTVQPGRILWIGSGRPHKNFDDLRKAIPIVAEALPWRLEVRVLGSFPDTQRHRVTRELAATCPDVALEFGGHVESGALLAHYDWADAYVSTSRLESFDNCIAEALACGVPIVASRIPVHVEYGTASVRYYDVGAPEALAREVVDVLQSYVPARAEAHRARRVVATRTWERTGEAYAKVFAQVGRADAP